jgi:hypothetical protein
MPLKDDAPEAADARLTFVVDSTAPPGNVLPALAALLLQLAQKNQEDDKPELGRK